MGYYSNKDIDRNAYQKNARLFLCEWTIPILPLLL